MRSELNYPSQRETTYGSYFQLHPDSFYPDNFFSICHLIPTFFSENPLLDDEFKRFFVNKFNTAMNKRRTDIVRTRRFLRYYFSNYNEKAVMAHSVRDLERIIAKFFKSKAGEIKAKKPEIKAKYSCKIKWEMQDRRKPQVNGLWHVAYTDQKILEGFYNSESDARDHASNFISRQSLGNLFAFPISIVVEAI